MVWAQGWHCDLSDRKDIDREERALINRPEYDAKSIGRNLKRLREAKKLTVDEVRRYLGVGSEIGRAHV